MFETLLDFNPKMAEMIQIDEDIVSN